MGDQHLSVFVKIRHQVLGHVQPPNSMPLKGAKLVVMSELFTLSGVDRICIRAHDTSCRGL